MNKYNIAKISIYLLGAMDKAALMAKLNAQMSQGPKKSAIPSRLGGQLGEEKQSGRRGTFYNNLADSSARRRMAVPSSGDCRIFTALRRFPFSSYLL